MVLKPMSLNFVKTMRLPALIEAVDIKQDGGLGMARALPAVYKCSNKIAVLNMVPWEVKLPKGTQIGEVHPLKLASQEAKISPKLDGSINEVKNEENLKKEVTSRYSIMEIQENLDIFKIYEVIVDNKK